MNSVSMFSIHQLCRQLSYDTGERERNLQVSSLSKEILTVSGGGCSAKDAQSIEGNHMQQKKHLPSRGVVLSVRLQPSDRCRGVNTEERVPPPLLSRDRRSLM